jgi:hypothetical protein
MPPRASAADYLSHVKVGKITIAAEFTGHSVPTLSGTPLTTEEFIVVEVALFGPAGERLHITTGDFSLRPNRRKTPLVSEQYASVFSSLKDPEMEEPKAKTKSKTNIGGGGGEADEAPPTPAKIPIPVQRAMAQRVQKVALPEGERPLPQAGLLFFEYRGKGSGIRSVELIYKGPAGEATLDLQP